MHVPFHPPTALPPARGSMFSWGVNGRGQLGHGTRQDCRRPKKVAGLSGHRIVQLTCGQKHRLVSYQLNRRLGDHVVKGTSSEQGPPMNPFTRFILESVVEDFFCKSASDYYHMILFKLRSNCMYSQVSDCMPKKRPHNTTSTAYV